ncbi:PACE efflux transporter [Thalassospira sp. TSL5-1]|uniref:PACE efflux transporter n=1 Tax=Thalassospira sp. TSL5-1 TaxID=1544451 RepID=UPI00093D1109|nr:PACE efflux transporter [Thalassospira sp. TSL5-1]OKH88978.1 membrane protein [Thalassospira sp. TSL5-1]
MRTTLDRIRHALSFEIIGLLIVIPLGGWVFDFGMAEVGVVALVSATIATLWNYLFNLVFDHILRRLKGDTVKSLALRVFHAITFEAGLLTVLMPFIAWYLDVSLWHAFTMDISFSAFYLVYAFVFNWAYDVIFPVPTQGGNSDYAQQGR